MFSHLSTIPDAVEIGNFAMLISLLINERRYQDALKFLSIILASRKIDIENGLNYLVLAHLELNIYTALNDNGKRLTKAKEIAASLTDQSITTQKSNLVGESGIEVIRKNAIDTIVNLQSRVPVINNQKYGRNDIVRVRYKDGVTIESKYKKVEQDLQNGECIVLQ